VTGQAEGSGPEEIRARLVIGADGTHSLVARQLGLVRPLPRLQRIALVSHWRGVSGDAIEMRARGRTVCGLGFPGPQAGTANLTLVVPTSAASQIAGRAGDFLEETLQTRFPDLAARLAGAEREPGLRTVGCFGHVCRPAIADGALLVGDAATFIDPFTGEGIYFALHGAQFAAAVATEALRANDTSRARLMAYDLTRRELARRYLLCDIVQAIVRTPALYNRVARRLDRLPDLAGRLFAVLGDLRPPGDVLNLDFVWRLATG
jgi:flavin-dependent dehydrogenase